MTTQDCRQRYSHLPLCLSVLDESWGFDRFADAIRALPEDLGPADLLSEKFHLYSDQRLSIYYAPFDHVNKRARLVLVGVTPGLRQMELAYRAARHGLLVGDEREAVLARCQASGQLRRVHAHQPDRHA
jgi:hypothetical protein